MKPTVHYDYKKKVTFDNDFAWLTPLNHPDTRNNNRKVNTSRIMSYDEITGIIETQNTIYKPYYELP